MLEDTAILFTSDHGTELWDKGRFGKGGNRLYAWNTRVPFVLRLPSGIGAGTTRDDFVQHQDIFPTICRLIGHPVECGLELDGRDLLDESTSPPEKVIIGWSRFLSVRDRNWNLFFDYTDGGEQRELYDLQADPGERENVYEKHPEVVRELIEYLEAKLGKLPYEIKHTGDRRQVPPAWWRYRRADGP